MCQAGVVMAAETTPHIAPTAVRTATVRRDLMTQCGKCGATGTIRTKGDRVTFGTILATAAGRHVGCDGRLVAYDIKVTT